MPGSPIPDLVASLDTRRAKLYDRTMLAEAKQAFTDHFRLDGLIPEAQFSTTTLRIGLSSLAAVELDLDTAHGQEVRGIQFDHGLEGDAYHPVLRFMYADPMAKGDLSLFPEQYEVETDQLVKITETIAKSYRDAYTVRVRIDRNGDGSFTEFDPRPPKPDPRSEWFPYADNVNKLIKDNAEGRYLVVSCISEKLTYSALRATASDPAQMRHLLALNMATPSQDLLSDAVPDTNGSYGFLALDLGHLCPPDCKK